MRLMQIFMISAMSIFVFGCATPQVTHTALNAKIYNYSGDTIEKVYFQPCNSDENLMWEIFVDTPLKNYSHAEVPLTQSCINLKAVDKQGKIVAKQWSIKKTYPFLWQIK